MLRGTDKTVLQHLGVPGEEVVGIEAAQELRFKKYTGGRCENTDFVLQPVEVDTRFASYGSIHHGQQGGGDIDIGNAPFEGRSGETTQVGHHAATQVNQ